jgi:hypothetical protein
VRCRDATASSFVVIVRSAVLAHFHAVAAKRFCSMRRKFTVWPARTNSLRVISSMSTKLISILYSLLFTCLALFGLPEFGLSVYASCCLSWTLV